MARRNFIAGDQQKLVTAYFQKQARFWEEIYYGTGIFEVIHQRRLRTILDFVDGFPRSACARALDIGCGTGHATIALARRGYLVCAVDAVPEMVETTRRAVSAEGLQSAVWCVRGDINRLPFVDHCFRLVMAIGVLPWLSSTEAAMREMCRVLEPGGHIIITIDNRWGFRWFIDPLTNPVLQPAKQLLLRLLGQSHKEIPFGQKVSIGECRATLRAHGLQIVEDATVGFGPFTLFRRAMLPSATGLALHRQLQRMADRGYPLLRCAGAQYIVSAQKPGASRTALLGPKLAPELSTQACEAAP